MYILVDPDFEQNLESALRDERNVPMNDEDAENIQKDLQHVQG